MPVVELKVCKHPAPPDAAQLPSGLAAPLVQASAGAAGGIVGRASGTRSALVSFQGVWYRLKGCGNGDKPFEVRRGRTPPLGEWRDVRGSAFVHSGRRELHMAKEIAAAGCASANVPLGLWRYSAEASPFGDSELLQAACCMRAREYTRG